jgi:hypothetical protein
MSLGMDVFFEGRLLMASLRTARFPGWSAYRESQFLSSLKEDR